MPTNKTPWLTYVLLAGGAYVAYKLYENYSTAATPASSSTTTAATTTTKVIPALPAPAGQTIADQVLSPVPSQLLPVATITSTLPTGITEAVYSVVQDWATTDGRAPVLTMAAAMVPSEYAGMYDLITNYWDKNIAPGPTQVAFWNALRAKYNPGDAIW